MNLFKTPFGSRLYGTATETSDYDWKIVYLPALEDLLVGTKNVLRNKFYSTSSKEFKNTASDTDTEYIALQTLCKDFIGGQAYAIEVVFALRSHWRIEGFEFLCDNQTKAQVLTMFDQLIDTFLTSQMNGMVGYAYHQAKLYGAKGERLNLLKELVEFAEASIDQHNGAMRVDDIISLDLDTHSPRVIALHAKYPDWFDYGPKASVNNSKEKYWKFTVFKKTYQGTVPISEFLHLMQREVDQYGKRANAASENEGHDWKALSHALRVMKQGAMLLTKGYIHLPFDEDNATYLRRVKQGEVSFEEVSDYLDKYLGWLDEYKTTTELPPYSDELQAEFDNWLKNWILDFYG